jgi:hypothetical protein
VPPQVPNRLQHGAPSTPSHVSWPGSPHIPSGDVVSPELGVGIGTHEDVEDVEDDDVVVVELLLSLLLGVDDDVVELLLLEEGTGH